MTGTYEETPVEDLAAWMDDRKTELADIAIRIIAERGYQALTFRNLAEVAGTSTRTFSYAFESRERLLDALIDRVYSRTWRLRGFDRDDDHEDPLGKLRIACGVAVQDQAEIDPHQRVLDRFVMEASYSKGAGSKTNALDEVLEARYMRLIDLARERGVIEPLLDSSDVVQLLWSVGDGLNIQRYANQTLFPPERMSRLFNLAFDQILGIQLAGVEG